MEKYKVKISKEDFQKFEEYYNSDKKLVEGSLAQLQKELNMYRHPMIETWEKMFNRHFMKRDEWKNTFSLLDRDNIKLKTLVDYCADKDLAWNVEQITESYLYVSFSGKCMFWDKKFCTLIKLPDYESLSLGEIKGSLATEYTSELLPAEMNALSINSINEEKTKAKTEEEKILKLREEISNRRVAELKKMQDEINKLEADLRKRKEEMMAESQGKLDAIREEMRKLDRQMYMMESEIYAIRSYTGETVELQKVRSGKKAEPDTPLLVNQKLLYLDEDLARIVSIYQSEIADNYDLFEDALKYSEEVFDSFCPQERCLTFFRLSKNATYDSYNADRRMYEKEALIHGKKIGFVLRDGECAYLGWLDESWRTDKEGHKVLVTFYDNLMYKPGEQEYHEYDEADMAKEVKLQDSENTMLSRYFAMSVVQGILDNKALLQFPEKVKITKPGMYIRYNYATGWLMDDRFGDFSTLVDNLNKRTKISDQILVCSYKWDCDGRGEHDRTHDCEVKEGINRVNFLESDEYGRCTIYVSARKQWSSKGATANVRVREKEYINITYMNSIWLAYYVQTKKLGRYCNDYAKMIKHFKRAIQILKEREAEEMSLIKKYYPEADQISEWEIKLSHWKLNHNIRFINDFQAKRVAKYLQTGKLEENKNLFTKENFFALEATDKNKYTRTCFEHRQWWKPKEEAPEFGYESEYYYQSFYISKPHTHWWLSAEEREENELQITKELPKLEQLVPERLKKDEKKLALVNQMVADFMEEQNVSVKDIKECPTGLTFEGNKLDFVRIQDLEKEARNIFFDKEEKSRYPEYILKSSCWQVAYYDYVHRQYDILLHEIKMFIHERFMTETVPQN